MRYWTQWTVALYECHSTVVLYLLCRYYSVLGPADIPTEWYSYRPIVLANSKLSNLQQGFLPPEGLGSWEL